MQDNERMKISEKARPLIGHFHDYILRGGFPQTALVENINIAQKLLREDIVDKVLKRDMTALFGVRRILELEKTFLYLCLHDGGILDMPRLCESLDLKKPTVTKFLELFEASHLIYKLPPHGYGKQILRARYKVYLADAAISGSVLLKGKSLLEDTTKLGAAVETAFFKHVYTRYYQSSIGFFYWRNKRGQEVDVIAEVDGRIIPFEVKYQKSELKVKDLKGLQSLIKERKLNQAYAITRDITDFGVLNIENSKSQILKIPAPLACFWLSQSEVENAP
ncbi:MAG: ATP-binding protein, partial [Candidatus Zixiibacteriota bacterium]